MKYLNPVDAVFLRMESKRTPMHVGALMTFRLPENAPRDFLQDLLAKMRAHPFLPAPFGYRIARTRLRRVAPSWTEADTDMEYHLRHSALPFPGGERELGMLVARLHSNPMDLTRPLWEGHLIEGLDNGRFAFYFKAHHCAIDGLGAVKMIKGWLSESADDRSPPGIRVRDAAADESAAEPQTLGARLRRQIQQAGMQIRSSAELMRALGKMSRQGPEAGTRAALATPRTLFNVPITPQRRLGTQLLDLRRVKAIAEATGATVNDVSLSLCGAAIRRYLIEQDALPAKSLMASVPMGLVRPDGKTGNAVAGFVCPLGTDEADPVRRLHRIHAITTSSKQQLSEMSPGALTQLALLGLSPLLIGQMTGLLPKMPPIFNFVVSNVVLSKKPLYLHGAELEAMYPVSFLFDGYALNVTLVGYRDSIAVGILGCRDAIPRLQRLAVYTGEALTELEEAIANPKPAVKARKTRSRKRA